MLQKILSGLIWKYQILISSWKQSFWNEVPYTRVEQGTYSTESKTLSLPWPALRYHSQNIPSAIETRKYHRGASVPKQIWPLPGTKYHCQCTKNRDFQQLTRVQGKNVNHIAGGVVQVHCRNSYNRKYARRARSNQLCVVTAKTSVNIELYDLCLQTSGITLDPLKHSNLMNYSIY